MPYIGKEPEHGNYQLLDALTLPDGVFNGARTVFNLTADSVAVYPGSPASLLISLGGVLQEPTTTYTVSGGQITFTTAPATGTDFFGVSLGDTLDIGIPSDASVTAAKIADDAVTAAKLANSINTDITANTAKVTNATHTGDVTGATALTIAADAVTTVKILDANVTLAKIANSVANTVLVRDANSSGVVSAKAVETTEILIGNGTGFTAAALSGDVTMTNAGVVTLGTDTIVFSSTAGTPATDDTVQGVVIEFLAVEAILQFDAVYVSTTTGRVGRADANDAAKLPAIGIAIAAQASAGSSVKVLTHGVYRDDGGFGGAMTSGVDLYVSEAPGTLTTTAPSDDGDFVQIMGVAIGARSAFINPDMTIIEVA